MDITRQLEETKYTHDGPSAAKKKNQLCNGTVPPERNSEISRRVLEKRIAIAEKKYLPHHKNSLIMMTRSLEGFRLTIIRMTVNLEGDGH